MSARRFVLISAATALSTAAVFAAFNVAVDPYLVFGMPRHAGFNALKPSAETHEWMMKAYQAPRINARTVVLGSSRTDIGFDPSSAAWPDSAQPVYNLSLAGAHTESSLRFLEHMLAVRGGEPVPKTLIVGLDFENFLIKPPQPQPQAAAEKHGPAPVDEVGERLAVLANGQPNPSRSLRVWKDYGASTLSLDAVIDSVQTLVANQRAGQANVDDHGHLSEARFTEWVKYDGVAALFEQKNANTVRDLSIPRRSLSDRPGGDVKGFGAVHRLIAFAKLHRMTLLLSVQPAHAMRLELLDYMDYWQDYEHFKRGLTQIAAAARADGVDVSLWDFGGYESYASEAVPANKDRVARLRWFWDPVHYTTALGDVMVATMLGQAGADSYGVRLEPATVEARLKQVRLDQQTYRQTRPEEVRRARQLLCTATACKTDKPA